MPPPLNASDVVATVLKIEDAYGTRREIDVVSLHCPNVSVQLHIDQKTLHDLITGRIGLKAGGLLTVQQDQRVAVELKPLDSTVTLILDRVQADDLRKQCLTAMGKIDFGDLDTFGA